MIRVRLDAYNLEQLEKQSGTLSTVGGLGQMPYY